jgi:hypothetical protein
LDLAMLISPSNMATLPYQVSQIVKERLLTYAAIILPLLIKVNQSPFNCTLTGLEPANLAPYGAKLDPTSISVAYAFVCMWIATGLLKNVLLQYRYINKDWVKSQLTFSTVSH